MQELMLTCRQENGVGLEFANARAYADFKQENGVGLEFANAKAYADFKSEKRCRSGIFA